MPDISYEGVNLECVKSAKYLGVILDQHLERTCNKNKLTINLPNRTSIRIPVLVLTIVERTP